MCTSFNLRGGGGHSVENRVQVQSGSMWYHMHNLSSFDSAEPMELTDTDIEESELEDVEQRCYIRRCYLCGSTSHPRPICSLLIHRQNRLVCIPSANPNAGMVLVNVDFQ